MGSTVHLVFHVSLLKKIVREYHEEEELPDNMAGDTPEVFEHENVLATCKVKHKGEEKMQLLVHRKGKPAEKVTWEDEILIRSPFPNFSPEDKAEVSGGGIVRVKARNADPNRQLVHQGSSGPKVWKVYSMRVKAEHAGSARLEKADLGLYSLSVILLFRDQ